MEESLADAEWDGLVQAQAEARARCLVRAQVGDLYDGQVGVRPRARFGGLIDAQSEGPADARSGARPDRRFDALIQALTKSQGDRLPHGEGGHPRTKSETRMQRAEVQTGRNSR